MASASTAASKATKPGSRAWRTFTSSKTTWFGMALLALIILAAVLAPLLTPWDPLEQDLVRPGPVPAGPTA